MIHGIPAKSSDPWHPSIVERKHPPHRVIFRQLPAPNSNRSLRSFVDDEALDEADGEITLFF
jgi:hypothetical protein